MSKLVKLNKLSENNYVRRIGVIDFKHVLTHRTHTKVELSNDNRINILDKSEYLSDLKNKNMAQANLSLETLLKLIPTLNCKKEGEIHRFLNEFEFANKNVSCSLKFILV